MKLSRKILLLALLNLLLLAALMVVFGLWQLRIGPESLLLGPARDRILWIGNAFAVEFDSTPVGERDNLLEAYGKRYGAQFLLVHPRGSIAGPRIDLPPELMEKVRRAAPRPADGPPGMEPRMEEDRPPPPERDDKGKGGRRPPPPPTRRDPPESVFVEITRNPTQYWAGVRVTVSGPDIPSGRPTVLLMRVNSLFNSTFFFDWPIFSGIALSVAAVTALCWLPFIRALTRSIAQMDRVTAQIAEGRFDAQVPNDRSDELGHLGKEINRLGARLQGFVRNQKRFVGDIAHELCAPIARIQFALGILERKADDELKPHVAVLNEEIQEMSGLVNELLSFSKAGLDAGTTALAAVKVAGVAQKAVSREASATGSIEVAVPAELSAMANEALLLRAISNVVRNAIRYAGGAITISGKRQGPMVEISIADGGPGLPEAELEEVFAPFYRPESARTRETGGAGLGLAIVRTCVEACGGTVSCRNRVEGGLEVTMRLRAG
jgi:two-component system sensor histidine kinase CpxA